MLFRGRGIDAEEEHDYYLPRKTFLSIYRKELSVKSRQNLLPQITQSWI